MLQLQCLPVRLVPVLSRQPTAATRSEQYARQIAVAELSSSLTVRSWALSGKWMEQRHYVCFYLSRYFECDRFHIRRTRFRLHWVGATTLVREKKMMTNSTIASNEDEAILFEPEFSDELLESTGQQAVMCAFTLGPCTGLSVCPG